MNQKYIQIAKNAGFGDAWFETSPAGFPHPMALLLKEYTEAIVRECATVGVEAVANGDLVEDSILANFGVEESAKGRTGSFDGFCVRIEK